MSIVNDATIPAEAKASVLTHSQAVKGVGDIEDKVIVCYQKKAFRQANWQEDMYRIELFTTPELRAVALEIQAQSTQRPQRAEGHSELGEPRGVPGAACRAGVTRGRARPLSERFRASSAGGVETRGFFFSRASPPPPPPPPETSLASEPREVSVVRVLSESGQSWFLRAI
eukprot:8315661-Pyramimonas_sp.AAC.1